MTNSPFMNTYHRLPARFERGQGCRLYDSSGRQWLDLTSGIAVNSLGHNHPALVSAIRLQSEKILHASNYFQTEAAEEFASRLVQTAGMRNVFLCNSGAEANEGAIKIARKYSYKKYGPGRHTIVTLKESFHGRTITTLAATGQDKFHTTFGPFTEGFRYVPPEDREALEEALDGKSVCAFLAEPVQGESGVRPLSGEYLRFAARLCAERDILLVFDEVQCGVGRCGAFFAHSEAGVSGDLVTLAKGLSGGVPVGAVLAGDKCADTLEPGDHGSTFGGNALAAACGLVVLDFLSAPGSLDQIRRKGSLLADSVKDLPGVASVRGRGLMLAADIDREAWPVLEGGVNMADESAGGGLLLLSAGQKTLRFLPPYIITESEIAEGLEKLRVLLAKGQ